MRDDTPFAGDSFRTLLVRPVQHPDEHHFGFLLRVADANGLKRAEWIAATGTTRRQTLARLCPLCLAVKDPFWHKSWLASGAPLCPVHRVWLVDHCTGCAKALRWGRVGLLECRCGHDLRDLVAPMASGTVASAILETKVPISVLMWLGALERYGPLGKPLKKASRQTMDNVADLAERGAATFVDWPTRFHQLLDDCRVKSGRQGPVLLNHALPGVVQHIRSLRSANWRSCLRDALASYGGAVLGTTAPLIGRNMPTGGPRSIQQLAGEMGVRSERFIALLDVLAPGEVSRRYTAGGRCRRVVSDRALEAVRTALHDRISVSKAAQLLAISVKRVEALTRSGLLPFESGSTSRKAVDGLLQGLDIVASPSAPLDDVRGLPDALRFWVPTGETGSFFESVLDRRIALYRGVGRDSGCGYLVSRKQVFEQTARPVPDRAGWVSIPEAAIRLRLKQQVVYHLVAVGLLPTEVRPVGRRRARAISVDGLAQFEQRIEPLSRCAARGGVDRRRAQPWARSRGLRFVSGPGIDGGRQFFVERDRNNLEGSGFEVSIYGGEK